MVRKETKQEIKLRDSWYIDGKKNIYANDKQEADKNCETSSEFWLHVSDTTLPKWKNFITPGAEVLVLGRGHIIQ